MNHKETLPAVVPQFSMRDRKVWALIAIVVLTVYMFVTQWGTSNAPGPAKPSQSVAASKSAPQPAARPRLDAKLDPLQSSDPSLMPQLEVDPKHFDQEKRNLFVFFVPPPPPPPPPPEPVCGDGMCNGKENTSTCPGDCPPPPPPPVCGDKKCEGNENYQNCESDCDPPPPPEITLKYIGFLNDDQGAVAFLTDGKEVYMGRVNDIIANRYRVVHINEDGIELGYVNMKGAKSRTIPFQGNTKG